MTTTTPTRYVTHAETNKLIRAALRDAFPGIKFSIRGTGGNATHISWTDGPNPKTVDEVARRYEGMTFDGMQDLASPIHEIVDGIRTHYGASYVFTRREHSPEILEEARSIIADAGIDPHGISNLAEIPATLHRYEDAQRLLWQGYPVDGPTLTRIIADTTADERYTAETTR
jgi:hypothetical protein